MSPFISKIWFYSKSE